jgi:hypothetical protein
MRGQAGLAKRKQQLLAKYAVFARRSLSPATLSLIKENP